MRQHHKNIATLLTTAALVAAASSAYAAPVDMAKVMKMLEAQGKKIEEQEKRLTAQQKELTAQRAAYEDLQRQLATSKGPGPSSAKSVVTRSDTPEVGTERKQAEPEKPPEIAAVIEEGGVLLPKGHLVITPSAEYTRSSAVRVAIEGFSIIPALNIGIFEISKVDRDTATAAVSGRLGITNRFEVEAKVPYVFRHDSTLARPIGPAADDTLSEVSGMDLGDVEVGAHYQINRGRKGWPFFIGNIRFKSITGTGPFDVPIDPTTGLQTELPTGSGFYAIQPSVTVIYPSDPVVYFANLGYIYNAPETYNGNDIDPGDSIGASFGMSLSLNDRASFSLGYSHSTVLETTVNGDNLRNGSMLQVGSLDFGYAYTLNDWLGINVNVSAGVTEDAPDSRLTVRVPMSMDLF